MNEKIYVHDLTETANHAGFKARYDVLKIVEANNINVKRIPLSIGGFFSRLKSVCAFSFFLLTVSNQKKIIINYPLAKPYNYILSLFISLFKLKVIFVIHDLNSLRNLNKKEDAALFKAKNIISHNEMMTSYLTKIGIDVNKIVNIDLFDYLVSTDVAHDNDSKSRDVDILVAGNLSSEKAGYLSYWHPIKPVHLFGVNFELNSDNYIYHGVFQANNPVDILKLHKNFYGLVWDGESADSCSGEFGEYLRYNNPHKASLYLCLGIPLIVWKESAIATFVKKERCGIVISRLDDINILFSPDFEHEQFFKNASRVSSKIKNGEYLTLALNKVE